MTSYSALPMMTEDTVPAGLCLSLARLVEPVINTDPAAFTSDTLVALKLTTLRRCFDDAMASVLTAHNLKMLPFPHDIWPLVMEHMPFDDLISASRVSRTWRAAALSHSLLWLTLHVDDQKDPSGPPWYTTNIPLLTNILSRSRAHFLDLEVKIVIANREALEEYNDEVMDFFDLVSPRLANLHIRVSGGSMLAGPILNEYDMDLPELCALTVSPPPSGCSGREPDCFLVTVSGRRMPKLVDLSVNEDLRMTFLGDWPTLQTLNCTSEGLGAIEPLVRSARGLHRLTFNWPYEWIEDIDLTPPDEQLLAALGAIPDVHVTAELAPVFEDQVFVAFGSSTAPRLLLTFTECEHYTGSFEPHACRRLSSATRLSIASTRSAGPTSTEIVLQDGAARTTRITTPDIPRSRQHPAVDWARVPSLEALTSLRVDASRWADVMCNFPCVPRLVELVLDIHNAAEIEPILSEAQRARLPRAESVVLVSDTDRGLLSSDPVQRLKVAVDASCVSVRGLASPMDGLSVAGSLLE